MPKAASCSSDCLTRSAALVSDRVAVSAAKISTAANAGAMLRKNDRDFDVTMIVSRAIRVSGGWDTQENDWDRFASAWTETRDRHAARRRTPAGAGV